MHTHSHTRKQSALPAVEEVVEGGQVERGYGNAFFCNNSISRISLPITHTHTSKETKALTTACSKLSTLTSTSQPPRERCAHTLTLLLCSALTAYAQSANKAHLHRPTLSHSQPHTYTEIYLLFFFAFYFVPMCNGAASSGLLFPM